MGIIADSLSRIAATLPLQPKKLTGRAGGVEAWYPYYAGFSEDFARTVLSNSCLVRNAVVLDPWNGSGTTTYIADKFGFTAFGFDINPVATLVANAKLARPRDAQNVLGLARRIAAQTLKHPLDLETVAESDALLEWLVSPVVSQYRQIESSVLADLGTGRKGTSAEPLIGDVPPLASFLLLALMKAARSLATPRAATNPTWVQPGKKRGAQQETLTSRWLEAIERMGEELSVTASESYTASESRVADSRSLPLADESIDFVLTSPPYCTRLDYVVSTSFELAALGLSRHGDAFKELRRRCMGTPLARKGLPTDPLPHWPNPVKEVLRRIREHPSKASASYYYKTFKQYFDDCTQSLSELHRCLRVGGAAALVVQSSYYKDISIKLADLYSELARAVGFTPIVISDIEVRRVLTAINSRSTRHRESTSYRESVLVLEKLV
jgi:hypothetical protein